MHRAGTQLGFDFAWAEDEAVIRGYGATLAAIHRASREYPDPAPAIGQWDEIQDNLLKTMFETVPESATYLREGTAPCLSAALFSEWSVYIWRPGVFGKHRCQAVPGVGAGAANRPLCVWPHSRRLQHFQLFRPNAPCIRTHGRDHSGASGRPWIRGGGAGRV